MIIQNVLIYDAVHREPYMGQIRVEGEKIAEIGAEVSRKGNEEVVEGRGLRAYPGFIDAHSHIGLDSYGGPTGGSYDYNEMNDIVCPQLRGLDSYNPQDAASPMALAAGVTTVCTGPGSANVLGGTALIVKLWGNSVEEAVIVSEAAMKCAFGENPKRCYKEKCDSARMTTAAKMREALFLAKDYMQCKEAAGGDISKAPRFDMKAEALIPVLKGKMPLKAHAHRADDLMTALRIAKEFGVRITLEHCTEGHLIVKELQAAGVPVAVGPTLTSASKLELVNKSWETPGILAAAGISVSIITDASVIPQEYLSMCAGLAVKAGMDPFEALRAITINPAKHLGVQNQIGSLEVGKDADIVLTEGDPLFTDSAVKMVFLNGKAVVGA